MIDSTSTVSYFAGLHMGQASMAIGLTYIIAGLAVEVIANLGQKWLESRCGLENEIALRVGGYAAAVGAVLLTDSLLLRTNLLLTGINPGLLCALTVSLCVVSIFLYMSGYVEPAEGLYRSGMKQQAQGDRETAIKTMSRAVERGNKKAISQLADLHYERFRRTCLKYATSAYRVEAVSPLPQDDVNKSIADLQAAYRYGHKWVAFQTQGYFTIRCPDHDIIEWINSINLSRQEENPQRSGQQDYQYLRVFAGDNRAALPQWVIEEADRLYSRT